MKLWHAIDSRCILIAKMLKCGGGGGGRGQKLDQKKKWIKGYSLKSMKYSVATP